MEVDVRCPSFPVNGVLGMGIDVWVMLGSSADVAKVEAVPNGCRLAVHGMIFGAAVTLLVAFTFGPSRGGDGGG